MEFITWYRNAPKLTKYYLSAVFIFTILTSIKLLKLYHFHLEFNLVIKKYQVIVSNLIENI